MTAETLAKALHQAMKEKTNWEIVIKASNAGTDIIINANFEALAARALALIDQWEAEKQPRP